jgi:outer membrane murein-binding lipoprotein Lpp
MSLSDRLRSAVGRLARDRRGAVAVEAAVVLSLLMLAGVVGVDGARYLQLTARAERLAANLADIASRGDPMRDRVLVDDQTQVGDVGMIFRLARMMARPADLTAEGGVVLSSVSGTGAGVAVNWMRADGPEATASAERLAGIGALPSGDDFIVVEVFLPFDAILLETARLGVGLPPSIYRRAVFRSRGADLSVLEALS